VLEEKRLRNEGTDSARTEHPSQDGDEMDEKNGKIAHQRMVAGRRILRNLGRNNNSPGTGNNELACCPHVLCVVSPYPIGHPLYF
jgi:hypothetical protein